MLTKRRGRDVGFAESGFRPTVVGKIMPTDLFALSPLSPRLLKSTRTPAAGPLPKTNAMPDRQLWSSKSDRLTGKNSARMTPNEVVQRTANNLFGIVPADEHPRMI